MEQEQKKQIVPMILLPKNEELYAKLGNALLKEMREQYKLENQGKARQGQPNWQELIYQDKPTVKPIKADLGKIKSFS